MVATWQLRRAVGEKWTMNDEPMHGLYLDFPKLENKIMQIKQDFEKETVTVK